MDIADWYGWRSILKELCSAVRVTEVKRILSCRITEKDVLLQLRN